MTIRWKANAARTMVLAFFGMAPTFVARGGTCTGFQHPSSVSFGSIVVEYPEHTGQPGQVYPASPWLEADFNNALSGCDTSAPSSARVVAPANADFIRGTYSEGGKLYSVYAQPSSPPGIGFIYEYTNINSSDFFPVNFGTRYLPVLSPSPASLSFKARVRLVVHGKFAPGAYPITTPFFGYREGAPSGSFQSSYLQVSGSLQFVAETCVVTSDNAPTVNIDSVRLGDFKGVGTQAGEARFDLSLRCEPGLRVFATMTDASHPENRSTTLSLATGSEARGVGYQILRDDNVPLAFGPDSTSPGTENQFHIADVSVAGGTVGLPLKVRYIQTERAIVPGTANAVATITFSYQ